MAKVKDASTGSADAYDLRRSGRETPSRKETTSERTEKHTSPVRNKVGKIEIWIGSSPLRSSDRSKKLVEVSGLPNVKSSKETANNSKQSSEDVNEDKKTERQDPDVSGSKRKTFNAFRYKALFKPKRTRIESDVDKELKSQNSIRFQETPVKDHQVFLEGRLVNFDQKEHGDRPQTKSLDGNSSKSDSHTLHTSSYRHENDLQNQQELDTCHKGEDVFEKTDRERDEKRASLENDYIVDKSFIYVLYRNPSIRFEKLKILEQKFAKKLEEHKRLWEIRLEELKATMPEAVGQVAAENEFSLHGSQHETQVVPSGNPEVAPALPKNPIEAQTHDEPVCEGANDIKSTSSDKETEILNEPLQLERLQDRGVQDEEINIGNLQPLVAGQLDQIIPNTEPDFPSSTDPTVAENPSDTLPPRGPLTKPACEEPTLTVPESGETLEENLVAAAATPHEEQQSHLDTSVEPTPPVNVLNMFDNLTHRVSPQMPSQIHPLQAEVERLYTVKDNVTKHHQEMKQKLNTECEKEIAEVVAQLSLKYDAKHQEAEAAYNSKKKELEINIHRVVMNGVLAEAYRSQCQSPTPSGHPVSQAELMQQLPRITVSPSMRIFHGQSSGNQQPPQPRPSLPQPQLQLPQPPLQIVHQPAALFSITPSGSVFDHTEQATTTTCSLAVASLLMSLYRPTDRSTPPTKVRKEKLGDRISALHQLVSPFGKTDTASVLLEATAQIRFLESQIEALSSPSMNLANNVSGGTRHQHTSDGKGLLKDLASRGLCLVPVACMDHIDTTNMTSNGAEFWTPALGGGF